MYWKQKHTTTTSAVLWARTTETDTLTCVCNEQTFTGDSVDGTDLDTDGCGTVTITGLVANKSYPFTLSAGSDSVSGTLRTHPESGAFNIAIQGCWSSQNGAPISYELLSRFDPVLIVNGGDQPYTDQAANNSGAVQAVDAAYSVASAGDNAAAYLANMHLHYLDPVMDAELNSLKQGRECFDMLDDHEMPGGNYDHSVASINQDGTIAWNQADVDNVWAESKKVIDAYHDGNAPNTDPEAVATKPEMAQAGTPASNYPVRYARKTIGNCEIFFLDCKTSCDAALANGGSATTLMGAAQRAWFEKYWTESTATFKCVFASKSLMSNNADNFYDMARYLGAGTQLDYDWDWLMDLFDNTNHPVFWMASDLHLPHVFVPPGHTHVYDIIGNPVSRNLSHSFVSQAARGAIWHGYDNAVTVLHVEDTYCQPLIVGTKGQIMWRGPKWFAGDATVTNRVSKVTFNR